MRVIHLATQDDGGAGRACVRLHKALLEQGVESIVITQSKTTDLPSIRQVASNKIQKEISKVRFRLFLSQLPLSLYPNRIKDVFSPDLPLFTLRNRKLISIVNHLKPDIVHLHWIGGGFLNIKDLESINAPILWSLHDANPYTGGCHVVPNSCTGISTHCKFCPLLKSKHHFDISFWTFRQRAKTYSKLQNLTINGLSKWITANAKDSVLLGSKPIINLPNPIDTRVYQPLNKDFARVALSITKAKKVISFGAIGGSLLPRKGFSKLKTALESLSAEAKSQCELLVFGQSDGECIDGMPTHYLGTLHDDNSLVLLYSASDIFITPSLSESFGQTALESLACGTPVVAFDTSGLKDIVRHKVNGYLAQNFDTMELKNGIEWILNLTSDEYLTLSNNARETAIQNFDAHKISHEYIQAYEKLIGGGAVDKLRFSNQAKLALHTLFPHISPKRTYYIGFGAIGGAVVARKGFYELKYALESLPDSLKSQCVLLVFGGFAPEIEGIKTHLLGFLSDDSSLTLAFNACDLFVTSSLSENLSNVTMESLACGTPVVAFDIGGNGDMITHKINGYLAQDANDLSKGIEWILNLDSISIQKMSAEARSSIESKFNSTKIAKAYIKTYKALVAK